MHANDFIVYAPIHLNATYIQYGLFIAAGLCLYMAFALAVSRFLAFTDEALGSTTCGGRR